MAMALIEVTNGVQLWRIAHPSGDAEAYVVKDPKRTPEEWPYGSRLEALKKFNERVKNAETEPPIR